jgi:hypothetical protein
MRPAAATIVVMGHGRAPGATETFSRARGNLIGLAHTSCCLCIAVATAMVAGAACGERPRRADLTIRITGPKAVEISQTANFTISVRDLGPDPARRPTVVLNLPRDVKLVGPSPALSHCKSASATLAAVVCALPSPLAPAASSVGAPSRESFAIALRSRGGFGRRSVTVVVRSHARDRDPINDRAIASWTLYSLDVRHLHTSSSQAYAGHRFAASGVLVRSDTGSSLRARFLRCVASVGVSPRSVTETKSLLFGTGAISGSHITCSWFVPRKARGEFFRATILARTHRPGLQTKFFFYRRIS